jgi:hypothetical protein
MTSSIILAAGAVDSWDKACADTEMPSATKVLDEMILVSIICSNTIYWFYK